MTHKIAMIIPYFGKFPEWIEMYLYSCSYQKMIDFHYYTDCELPEKIYVNTIFHKITFKDYCQMVSSRLSIDFYPNEAYKLTDLKPFYGYIHQDLLKGYEFWAFGDIDIVFGDLSPLVNERNLKKYDLLTTHSYHIAGHFTICRNIKRYNELCFKYLYWKEMLIDIKHYGFDESYWSTLVYPQLGLIRRVHKYFFQPFGIGLFSYLNIANKLFCNRWTKRHFKEYYTSPCVEPKDGLLPEWVYDPQTHCLYSHTGRSLIYLHFLFFKKTPWFDTDYYWHDDFWKIGKVDDYSQCKKIGFNYKGLTFKEQ